jgi:ATP-dependent Lhr-like helicase
MPLTPFHPALRVWFDREFRAPTAPQAAAWPAIHAREQVLIAAPTGSGKTLAAFLAAIDDLLRQGLNGQLSDTTQVVYVSPLKALSNDIERNLDWPLAGIRAELKAQGLRDVELRVLVRTGDTSAPDRAAMKKRPPHVLVTTPESLYLLLTSESGRAMLATVKTVIVDEIHALAASKRGAHLALSLERLAALAGPGLQRIGLSATQKPIEEIAQFLVGSATPTNPPSSPFNKGGKGGFSQSVRDACTIIDTGHVRERDLALELPGAPLEAVMSGEVWDEVYHRLAELIHAHKTTLVFANTRRSVERITRHLSERLGAEQVAAHHGSLSKEQRFEAEQRLKHGKLRAMVATASLELGIDIGDVDLVCQLGSPRAIATLLQRVGRANHSVGGVPKGRLFPLSRDELVECVALLEAVRRGELDRLRLPEQPLDVLAQQLVAEVAAREWDEDALYAMIRRAWPYRALTRAQFDAVVHMLSEGFATRRGRRSAYLHRDAVNRRLRGRKGARLTALTCGGAIPDTADYRVVLEPEEIFVGTLNEDFAVESQAGDIFQLGNRSYRIRRIEAGQVRVEDARGAPPTIPFWLGEAPGRSDELSQAVARLRSEIDARLGTLTSDNLAATTDWLMQEQGLALAAARQLTDYLGAAKGVLGVLPTQTQLVFERFFDETGGQQLVVHSPFGSRLNRAWGLALRKRFCRKFNFELQAAATEDAIILSLGETHSFPLEEIAQYLSSRSVRAVLIQALLTAPLFNTRWRWVATIALAIKRFRGGKKNPPQFQRIEAEDLVAVVFPDQIACAENLVGEREVPDHPLVNQTIHDCLTEAMDIDGLITLLTQLEKGAITVTARDLPHPSPLAQEILGARPYAFLDDAPLEERRTQAVMSRRWLDPLEAKEFGQLDAEAIARVRAEAWPEPENADEVHDALMLLGAVVDEARVHGWQAWLRELVQAKRAALLKSPLPPFEKGGVGGICSNAVSLWVTAERLPLLQAIYPHATLAPALAAPEEFRRRSWSREDAATELLRGQLQALGPVTETTLIETFALDAATVTQALLALQGEGFAMQGSYTPGTSETQWCERRLLARIHRYTIERLRAEIEPVTAAAFMRFLLHWHGITSEPRPEGPQALAAVIAQLEGFEAAAAAWEADLLAVRLQHYDPEWLDGLCLAGRVLWARLSQPREAIAGPVRSTPIALLRRAHRGAWQQLTGTDQNATPLPPRAQTVASFLTDHGASFFDDIVHGTGLLKTQTEEALATLVATGCAHADSFSGLRALLVPSDKRGGARGSRRRRLAEFGIEEAGRWNLIQTARAAAEPAVEEATVEFIARLLLKRYGVVSKRLLEREGAWLPPWYALLRVYRRLEARGEIRGGRFIAGLAGEQYALPEAVSALRAIRRAEPTGVLVSLSAADPLNLIGILTPGARVPALAGNRILLRDGVPVAVQVGGETKFLEPLDPAEQWNAQTALRRQPLAPALRAYLH